VSNSGKNNDRDTAIIDPVEKSALVPTEFGFGEVKGSSSSGGAGQRQKGGAASGNENGDQGQQATRQKSTGGQKGGMAVNQDADAVARAEAEELVRQRWAAQQQQQQLEGLQTSSSSSSSSSSRAGAAPVNGASGAEKTSKAKATTGATRSNSPDVVDQGEEGGEDDNGSVRGYNNFKGVAIYVQTQCSLKNLASVLTCNVTAQESLGFVRCDL
jgi:hypothetical protein